MRLARFSVKNVLLINLAMATILLLGAYAFLVLPREASPDINFNWAFVTTPYPGAAPIEVEQLVTIPMEEAIREVSDVNMVTSTSSEGLSFISVKFAQNMSRDDFDKRFQDLQTNIRAAEVPDGAEDPDIRKLDTQDWWPVVSVAVSGQLPEPVMNQIAEDLMDLYEQNNDVGQLTAVGMREREIWVEADPDAMNSLGIGFQSVVQALAARNLNVPGGELRPGGRGEFLVRTLGKINAPEEVRQVIIRTGPSGRQVRVGDVAEVTDAFEKARMISRLDGEPCITINVAKKRGASTIDVVDDVRELTARYEAERLVPGARLNLVNDSSEYIIDIIDKLQSNAVFGIVFVTLALWLFIGWRAALAVVVGMPVTFAVTFIFMRATGRSLDGNALFGLVLVLGMIVDHAIVIAENCVRHLQMDKSKAQAVIDGVGEVFQPVLAATLTTIAAFLPLMLMPGIMGAFMRIIPLVVTLALVASNFEAFLILPAHVMDWTKPRAKGTRADNRWFRTIRFQYLRLLRRVVQRRYLAVALFLLIAVGSAFLVPLVGVEMFEGDPLSRFYVRVWMPLGTSLETTDEMLSEIEKIAMELPDTDVSAVVSTAGMLLDDEGTRVGDRYGQVLVDIPDGSKESRSIPEILADMRMRCSRLTGYEMIRFTMDEGGPPTGKPVEVKVKGPDLERLQELVEELKGELATMPGVYDIGDNFSPGKEELRIKVNDERARMHGLDAAQIAMFVRTAVNGTTATAIRDGNDDVDVIVKVKGGAESPLERIKNLRIAAPGGGSLPLRETAAFETGRGYSDILRFEYERSISVFAEVDPTIASAVAVNREMENRFANLSKRYPGYRLDFRGEFAEFRDAFNSLAGLFALGVFIIFLLLTAQFKSLIQPFIILFTIPFAFVGAVVGLIAIRAPFSLMTLYGIVALAGIVVNDSIVLIDFINKRRSNGAGRWRAVLKGGALRLRPVLLTSITTIAGLLPMALGIGGGSEVWAPLANTIVWGLSSATFMTLFLVPALYAIADDAAQFRERLRARRPSRLEAAAVSAD